MPPSSSRRPSAAAPPKVDGRKTHIIDRALDYLALAESGYSAARIARKRRRSEGYVSITLRLGRAIAGMEPPEIAALRSPRITWKLAQRIVRERTEIVAIRHQLRSALGGFSTHNVDGRRVKSAKRPAAPAGLASTSWGWDAAWFARDPIGFVEAHLQYLASVHAAVRQRATRATASSAAGAVPVGQSIRSLQRTLARSTTDARPLDATPKPSAEEQRALAMLAAISRQLTEIGADARTRLRAIQHPVSPADAQSWGDALADDLAE